MISELIIQQAAQEAHAQEISIALAWKAYYGQMPKPLKTNPDGTSDSLRINFPKLIVNKGVSYLFGKEVGFDIADDDSGKDGEQTPADIYLSTSWKKNKKMTRLLQMAINGGVCGHTFVRLMLPLTKAAFPRIIVLDPATVTPIYAGDDKDDIWAFIVQMNCIDPVSGKPYVKRQIMEREDSGLSWTITDQISAGDSKVWIAETSVKWPYPFAPVFHCQNQPEPNAFWGLSDLDPDVLEICHGMNCVTSDIKKIIRYHASPKTVGIGLTSSEQISTNTEGIIFLPEEGMSIEMIEMKSNLESSLEFRRSLKEDFHETTRIPEIATGAMRNIGALSGVAMETMYRPLLELTQTKQVLYGDMLAELNAAILEIGGFGKEREVANNWPNVLPVDDLQTAQVAVIAESLGASKATLLERLGYDPEAEADKKAQEKDAEKQFGAGLLSDFEKGKGMGNGSPPGTGDE